MVLDAALLNAQHYKVRIKGKKKREKRRKKKEKREAAFPFEKRAFGSPSTKVANFTFIITVAHLNVYIHKYLFFKSKLVFDNKKIFGWLVG